MDRQGRHLTHPYRACAGNGSACSLHEMVSVCHALFLECHLLYQRGRIVSLYAECDRAHRKGQEPGKIL